MIRLSKNFNYHFPHAPLVPAENGIIFCQKTQFNLSNFSLALKVTGAVLIDRYMAICQKIFLSVKYLRIQYPSNFTPVKIWHYVILHCALYRIHVYTLTIHITIG